MSWSVDTICAGCTSVNADDPERPARTASLTTRPSVESTFVVRKSVSRIESRLIQTPGREQRSERPDAERAQSHEHGDRRDEDAERVDPASRGSVPAHVRRGLERDRRDRAVRRRRRTAWRERRRGRHRATRHALHVAGPKHHGQAERHHDERAGEDPLGKSDADDRRLGDDRDDDERDGVDRERLSEHARAAEQHRRHRRSAAAGDRFEHSHDVARRSAAGSLGSFARHRITSSASGAGTSARSSPSGRGSSLMCAASIRCAVRSGKTGWPVEQLVRHRAERVDVGAMIDARVAGGLLGRHVRGRADRRADLRERRAAVAGPRRADGFRDAEVGDDRGAAGEQHVVRLDVAVHDAALVRVGERLRDVLEDARRLRRRRAARARDARAATRPRRTASCRRGGRPCRRR